MKKEGAETIYQRILKEQQRLDAQICSLQGQLKNLPEGKLICSHHGNQCKWYRSDGKVKTYISKKDKSLAEQLAVKRYLSLVLEELQQEKIAIDFYLRHHHSGGEKAEKLLVDNPGYQELLAPYFSPKSHELSEWMKSPYPRNMKYPEQLIHKTSSGSKVRSKSEAMIDWFLRTNGIPFRYECALELGHITLFPDFTIRHPKTGEFYYWEHFGLMDDSSYAKNACFKIQTYISHGIIPSIHLITTYETKENPLTSEVIEKIISHYFL